MNQSKRFYLDYNATSPLSDAYRSYLTSEDYIYGNPSSQHSTGKKAMETYNQNVAEIYDFFEMAQNEMNFMLHSGATEASNTFLNLQKDDALIYFDTDHACIRSLVPNLEARGVKCFKAQVNSAGLIDSKEIIKIIQSAQKDNNSVWLSFTWANNETGVIWDLKLAHEIKEKTNCKVYVDATQIITKTSKHKLNPYLDVYSFSSHKFGGLKGVGFSFYNNNLEIRPMILGGGQQNKVRSGTLNLDGMISTAMALKAWRDTDFYTNTFKNEIETLIKTNQNLELIPNTSSNTISFVHKEKQADLLLIQFDMAGLDVGSGSACSSGSLTASNTLLAMGYGEKAKNSIRISFGPNTLNDQEEVLKRLKEVVAKL